MNGHATQPLPQDHPLMVAWNEWKNGEDGEAAERWAQVSSTPFTHPQPKCGFDHPHLTGSLWAAFLSGWKAAGGKL